MSRNARVLSKSLIAAYLEQHDELLILEQFAGICEEAFKERLELRKDGTLDHVGITADYLLCVLQRMRLLSWGIIDSLNSQNAPVALLCTRAAFEVTACTCHVRDSLRGLYRGNVTRKDMSRIMLKARFATRDPYELTPEEEESTRATNILTMLATVDKHLKAFYEFSSPSYFSDWYKRLCEFTHPNALGLGSGSELQVKKGFATYERTPAMGAELISIVCLCASKAQVYFAEFYDDCWNMLIDNEDLPSMFPDGDPRIGIR